MELFQIVGCMNKVRIEQALIETLIDTPRDYISDVLSFRIFSEQFDLYQFKMKDEKVFVNKYPKIKDNYNNEPKEFTKIHLGLTLNEITKNESVWIKTLNCDYSGDTYVVGEDFCLQTASTTHGFVNSLRIHCKTPEVADRLSKYCVGFVETREKPKFNYVTSYQGGFGSTEFILPEGMDIPLENYLEDFPYTTLKEYCEGDNPGIFMLYGEPGCGKSYVIRKLIQDCDTDFYIMDSSILNNITSASFVDYLTDECSNCVLILEDCEQLLKDREHHYNPLMGVMLNLTDGLLGDGLKLKFICTFNTDISTLDMAILRKGRLKGKYEFKKLPKDKANALCKRLGKPEINRDATLADIYNSEENDFSKKQTKKIGF